MTDSKEKKAETKVGFNPLAVAITGAVVGAGIVAAGVMALKDKNNNKKVKKALTKVKQQATDFVKDVQTQTNKIKDEIEETIVEEKDKVLKTANKVKSQVTNSIKDIKNQSKDKQVSAEKKVKKLENIAKKASNEIKKI